MSSFLTKRINCWLSSMNHQVNISKKIFICYNLKLLRNVLSSTMKPNKDVFHEVNEKIYKLKE